MDQSQQLRNVMTEIVFDMPTKRHVESLGKSIYGINDIYLFGTNDDIGPLASPDHDNIDSIRLRYRTKILNAGEIFYQAVNNQYYEQQYKTFRRWFDESLEDTHKVIELLTAGEELRIWTGNMPHLECGLAYLCYTARNSNSKLYTVKCPDDRPIDKYGNTHWVNINPDYCRRYEELIKELSVDERDRYCKIWQRLTKENSNLRILKDGKIISVPDDYFDAMIRAKIDKGYKTHTELLDNCMHNLPEFVHHSWLCYRIEVIERGVDDIPDTPLMR